MTAEAQTKTMGSSTVDIPKATAPGTVSAVDFHFYGAEQGKAAKTRPIVDGNTRACLGGPNEFSVPAEPFIEALWV